MSTILRSVSMCSIWLGGLLLNIPGASVHTFRWSGVLPTVSSPGCSNLRQGYNQFRFPLFLVTIRSCSLPPVEAGSSGTTPPAPIPEGPSRCSRPPPCRWPPVLLWCSSTPPGGTASWTVVPWISRTALCPADCTLVETEVARNMYDSSELE